MILLLILVSIILCLCLIGQCAWLLRKMAITSNVLSAEASNGRKQRYHNFRQVEDLLALYHGLSPRSALPKTRGWAASPDFLRVLMEQIKERRPDVVLELGSGASTIVAGYALEQIGKGHLYSIDHEAHYLNLTSDRVRDHGLEPIVSLIHAHLVERASDSSEWYDTERFPDVPIDILVIDGPPASTGPMARYPALPELFDRLNHDSRIIVDDNARDDETKCISAWIDRYPLLTVRYAACEKGCAILTLRRDAENSSPQ